MINNNVFSFDRYLKQLIFNKLNKKYVIMYLSLNTKLLIVSSASSQFRPTNGRTLSHSAFL